MNWLLILLLILNNNSSTCSCETRKSQRCNTCKKEMSKAVDPEILRCGPSCELKEMMPPSWHTVTEEKDCNCEM